MILMSLQNWKLKCLVRSLITSYHKNLTLSYHMKSVIEMLGWIVVWYHAPHHIGGGIVCLRTCSLCAWALTTLGSVLSHSLLTCVLRLLMASCPLVRSRCILCVRAHTRSRLYVALCASIYRGTMKSSCACVCYEIIR